MQAFIFLTLLINDQEDEEDEEKSLELKENELKTNLSANVLMDKLNQFLISILE